MSISGSLSSTDDQSASYADYWCSLPEELAEELVKSGEINMSRHKILSTDKDLMVMQRVLAPHRGNFDPKRLEQLAKERLEQRFVTEKVNGKEVTVQRTKKKPYVRTYDLMATFQCRGIKVAGYSCLARIGLYFKAVNGLGANGEESKKDATEKARKYLVQNLKLEGRYYKELVRKTEIEVMEGPSTTLSFDLEQEAREKFAGWLLKNMLHETDKLSRQFRAGVTITPAAPRATWEQLVNDAAKLFYDVSTETVKGGASIQYDDMSDEEETEDEEVAKPSKVWKGGNCSICGKPGHNKLKCSANPSA